MSIIVRRGGQTIEETAAENHRAHGATCVIGGEEEPTPAHALWLDAGCEGERGHRAGCSTRAPAEAEPGTTVLFHVGRGKSKDAGEIRWALIVHAG